ncbi:hypothetical protein [Clostridium sp.]
MKYKTKCPNCGNNVKLDTKEDYPECCQGISDVMRGNLEQTQEGLISELQGEVKELETVILTMAKLFYGTI